MASIQKPESIDRASGVSRLARDLDSLSLTALRATLSGRTSTTTRYY